MSFKKCEVRALMCGDKHSLFFAPYNIPQGKKHGYTTTPPNDKTHGGCHMFINSNDIVNVGDYIFLHGGDGVREVERLERFPQGIKVGGGVNYDEPTTKYFVEGGAIFMADSTCKKVIASTHPDYKAEGFPSIPYDFIEEWCKSDGSIKNILVEYDSVIKYGVMCVLEEFVKVNSDNVINIKKYERNWGSSEVEQLIHQYRKDLGENSNLINTDETIAWLIKHTNI